MDKRILLSGCTTPICGAKLSELNCKSYDVTVCYHKCVEIEQDMEQMDLFDNYTDEDINNMYEKHLEEQASTNYKKDLTSDAEVS